MQQRKYDFHRYLIFENFSLKIICCFCFNKTSHAIFDHYLKSLTIFCADVQLIVSMGDLFVAGGETTATTLRWGVLLLAYHCDVQIKMQNEIDAVVGRERLPTFSDREM